MGAVRKDQKSGVDTKRGIEGLRAEAKGLLLVTNQSFFAANPENWVVFDVFVDDLALPLIEPRIP